MTTAWDANRVKAQLRLTAQRLGQIQYKMDAQAQITRRDIATLLQQRNVALARAKAQKLIREDVYGDLLQTLEMQVGVLLEHLGEFERSEPPSPVVIEAASSIIYAAPHTDSRDLLVIKDLLVQRLGPDFARSAAGNQDNYVSARVLRDLSALPPTATNLDHYLYRISKTHSVHWMPDFQPHEKVDQISAMLDPTSIPVIDLSRLRILCSHGLPEYPSWLRPRVWRLLLGTLPPQKTAWKDEARKQRENYYDLVRRLLEPIASLPSPTTPLSPLDASLVETAKELDHVPQGLFVKLEEPEATNICPLDATAPDDIRIPCAFALDTRLRLIRDHESQDSSSPLFEAVPEIRLEATPEIRLELPEDESDPSALNLDDNARSATSARESSPGSHLDAEGASTPEISLSAPDSPTSTNSGLPTTLLASRVYSATGAHPKHASALLRLLYIHASLNPAHRSPQIASLLVPLYSALVDEVDPEDAAHMEADAFWLFEAMVGELSELEDAEGSNVWMQKFGETASWADTELVEDLQAKGLDPALPHYSYRWLTTALTHTLPLPSILMIWDALFSRPPRDKGSSPKMDYLLDICTSMLICARGQLFGLGRPPRKPLNLWGGDTTSIISTPLTDRELDEAFAAGMAFLQSYPVNEVGGVDRILQLAYDLAARRETKAQTQTPYTVPNMSVTAAVLGARLRNSVWGPALTSAPAPAPTPIQPIQEAAEDDTDSDTDSSDDSDDERQPRASAASTQPQSQSSTLGSRLASTVWKGITNQSAMEPPPTPDAHSPTPPSSFADSQDQTAPPTNRTSAIWGYAEKLRDSDAAATFAKVSTNWKVKAFDAWSKRGSVASAPATANPDTLSPSWVPTPPRNRNSVDSALPATTPDKRSSLPEGYSTPAKPAFFRPVRDSIIGGPRRDSLTSPTGSDVSAHSENDAEKYRRTSLSTTLATLTRTPSPRPKSTGPRPLLLGSGSLMSHSRSPTLPAAVLDKQFADAVRAKRPSGTSRGSQSSVSSASPQDHIVSARRVRTPDASSRVVPLNRTQSPMARARRQESVSSAASSPAALHRQLPSESSPEDDIPQRRPERQATNARDSTTTVDSVVSSSPPPEQRSNGAVRVVPSEAQRGSVVLNAHYEDRIDFPTDNTPKSSRKNSDALSLHIDDSSDSSVVTNATQVPTRAARVRSKRYPPRLGGHRANSKSQLAERASSPNSLAAPDLYEEGEATTPKATSFDYDPVSPVSRRPRKSSGDGRARKISDDGSGVRVRKISTERPKEHKHKRDSAAAEGDDEGYDDLLSAYESEDGLAI